MKKYYVKNGRIVINKYCIKYNYTVDNGSALTMSEVYQYAQNDDELNSITNELEAKNIPYKVELLDVADIEKYNGIPVSSDEDARKIVEPNIDEVKANKLKEISDICEQTIYKGIDVTLSDGATKHFSLKIEDQINIFRLAFLYNDSSDDCVINYHSDSELCMDFSKEDFFKIVQTANEFISKETNYCNKLMNYIKSQNDIYNVLNASYGIALKDN